MKITKQNLKKFGLLTNIVMITGIGLILLKQSSNHTDTSSISTIQTTTSIIESTKSSIPSQISSTQTTATSETTVTNSANNIATVTSSITLANSETLMSLPRNTSNTSYQYTIKQGDIFWCLAEKYYGSAYNWVDLMKANNFSDEKQYNLYVDEVVVFPEVSQVRTFEKTSFCK